MINQLPHDFDFQDSLIDFVCVILQLSGGISNSGQMPTICGANNGQHVIYSAIPSFPARLSVVVDTQVQEPVSKAVNST